MRMTMRKKNLTGKSRSNTKHKILEVLLGHKLIGTLTWFEGDDHIFEVDPKYDWDNGDAVMTLSMKEHHGGMSRSNIVSHVRIPPFFSNLLPEGFLRDYLAAQASVKPQREFQLLDALKDDLPGAIVLRPLEDGKKIAAQPSRIFGADYDDEDEPQVLRFSLAGIQLKFSAVLESSGGLTIPANGVGGSFIVKLPSTRFQNVPQNEYSMMMLARQLGIRTADVELRSTHHIAGLPPDLPENFGDSLIVKRFDRVGTERVHMEDFAQVYGLYSNEKYSRVSYGGIASVIFKEAGAEQLQEYVRRLTYTLLIGNADMHLKNWSLLYQDPQQPILSPAYDFISTIQYLPDPNLALSIAKEKSMSAIEESHFRKMAVKAQLPENLVVRTMKETVSNFREVWPKLKTELPLEPSLVETIERHQAQLRI
jgi:serine/threonine-protein kinase HipA